MGLDLMLYKAKPGYDIEQVAYYDENESDYLVELAYGRKAWEICDWFGAANGNGYTVISPEDWYNFIKKFEGMGDKLDAVDDAFNRQYNAPVDYPEFVFTDEHKKLIAEYEYWYNCAWNDDPTLGYDFSVGYMKAFYQADAAVRKAWEEGWDVILVASY